MALVGSPTRAHLRRGCPLPGHRQVQKEELVLAWLYLLGAIGVELFATTALKLSDGFTKIWWTLAMGLGYGVAFYLLSLVVKTIPLGVAYAVWSGVGTLGAVLISILVFKSDAGLAVWIGAALVIGGVVIMNLGSNAH